MLMMLCVFEFLLLFTMNHRPSTRHRHVDTSNNKLNVLTCVGVGHQTSLRSEVSML